MGQFPCGGGRERGVWVGPCLEEDTGTISVVEEDGQVEGCVATLGRLTAQFQSTMVSKKNLYDLRVVEGHGEVECSVARHCGLSEPGLLEMDAAAE